MELKSMETRISEFCVFWLDEKFFCQDFIHSFQISNWVFFKPLTQYFEQILILKLSVTSSVSVIVLENRGTLPSLNWKIRGYTLQRRTYVDWYDACFCWHLLCWGIVEFVCCIFCWFLADGNWFALWLLVDSAMMLFLSFQNLAVFLWCGSNVHSLFLSLCAATFIDDPTQ